MASVTLPHNIEIYADMSQLMARRLTTNQEILGVTPGVVTRFEFLNDLFFLRITSLTDKRYSVWCELLFPIPLLFFLEIKRT